MGFVARKSAYYRGPERQLNAVHPCKRRQNENPARFPRAGSREPSCTGLGQLAGGLRFANTWARQRFLTKRPAFARSYTKRRRRLSSITRAPCRKVMGVP